MKQSLSRRRVALKNRYKHVYTTALALVLVLNVVVPLVHAQASEELLARKPFVATAVMGMAVTKNRAGTPLAVVMPQGLNSTLEIIDLKANQRLLTQEVKSDNTVTAGVAYVTLPNRHVLIGTSAGFVYDVDPDKLAATEQTPADKPLPTFEDAVLGSDNTVYLTASLNGLTHLYAYNYAKTTWREATTFTGANLGLAYGDATVYVGDGASTSFWKYNPATGNKAQLPIAAAGDAGPLHVSLASDGYVYLASAKDKVTLVYDIAHDRLTDRQPLFGAMSAPVASTKPAAPAPTTQTTETKPTTDKTTSDTQTNTDTTTQGTTDQTQPTGTDTTTNDPTTTDTTTNATSDTSTTDQKVAKSVTDPVIQTQPVVQEPAPVYYGALSRYDATSQSVTQLSSQKNLQPVKGNCWIDANRCVVYDGQGNMGMVYANTRYFKSLSPSPIIGAAQPTGVVTIAGDDTMYAASIGTGASVFQVDRDTLIARKMVAEPFGSVASLTPVGSRVLAGTTTGQVAVYDSSTKSTTPTFVSPTKLGDGSVDALAEIDASSVVFALSQTGAQPTSSVGVYDIRNQSVSVKPVAVSDQKVGALAYRQGIAYVGGKGAAGAALVAYDVANGKATAKLVPVPNASNITSLVVLPNGHLYGVADSTVFVVDTTTMTVLQTKPFYSTGAAGNIVSAQNKLYASVGGKLYTVQPDDLSYTQIGTGTNVAVDSLGDYYYSRDGALYRILTPRQAVNTGVVQSVASGFNVSKIDLRLAASILMLLLALIAIALFRQHRHNHPKATTYRLRR